MEHEHVDYVGGQHQNPYQQPNQQPQNYNKGQNSYQSSGQNFNKGQSNYQARGQLGQSHYRTSGTQPPQNPNTYRNQGNYQQNRPRQPIYSDTNQQRYVNESYGEKDQITYSSNQAPPGFPPQQQQTTIDVILQRLVANDEARE